MSADAVCDHAPQGGDLCPAVCAADAAAHGWPPYGVRLARFTRRTTVMHAKIPGTGFAAPGIRGCFLYFMSLYRNVTICALVHGLSGLNVLALVPCVMFFDTAHRTAL